MKELIAGLAILLILIIFPLQAQVDTINAFKINHLNRIVYNSAEQARFDGYFTDENINETKQKLAKVFGVSEDDITFEGTRTIKYRSTEYNASRDRIEYKITVPFRNIVAAADFLGISQDENTKSLIKQGFVLSEVLKP